ncbi:hypothetical protein DFJ73DRAFT_968701 [Zopfochytrium polystomum]|nr:hypothetical protein DFJ73DRAFT_968701 [Zopfochytrium polystomum]
MLLFLFGTLFVTGGGGGKGGRRRKEGGGGGGGGEFGRRVPSWVGEGRWLVQNLEEGFGGIETGNNQNHIKVFGVVLTDAVGFEEARPRQPSTTTTALPRPPILVQKHTQHPSPRGASLHFRPPPPREQRVPCRILDLVRNSETADEKPFQDRHVGRQRPLLVISRWGGAERGAAGTPPLEAIDVARFSGKDGGVGGAWEREPLAPPLENLSLAADGREMEEFSVPVDGGAASQVPPELQDLDVAVPRGLLHAVPAGTTRVVWVGFPPPLQNRRLPAGRCGLERVREIPAGGPQPIEHAYLTVTHRLFRGGPEVEHDGRVRGSFASGGQRRDFSLAQLLQLQGVVAVVQREKAVGRQPRFRLEPAQRIDAIRGRCGLQCLALDVREAPRAAATAPVEDGEVTGDDGRLEDLAHDRVVAIYIGEVEAVGPAVQPPVQDGGVAAFGGEVECV